MLIKFYSMEHTDTTHTHTQIQTGGNGRYNIAQWSRNTYTTRVRCLCIDS